MFNLVITEDLNEDEMKHIKRALRMSKFRNKGVEYAYENASRRHITRNADTLRNMTAEDIYGGLERAMKARLAVQQSQ